ncbi:hypothetical protein DL96DRAFT_1251848 [Flagelloscypha sp. PMI_526]|nr:hypothetical protein DL96DRAFT_1251848 [Flagelloscypha sp. PMI_526]
MAPSSPLQRRDERARHIAHRQITAGTAGGSAANGFSLTGPITITVFVPPSTTNNLPQATTPLTTPLSNTLVAPPTIPSTSSVAPIVAPPSSSSSSTVLIATSNSRPAATPSVSVVASPSNSASAGGTNGASNGANGALSSGSSGISTGAIVGIVIAILFVLIAVVVFFLRRKNIFARKKRRATWLAKGGIMGPKLIPEYDNSNFNFVSNVEKQAPSPPVPAGFGISSRETYVPGGATEAAAFAYSTNSYMPQPDLAPPPSSYLNNAPPTSGFSPVVMKDGQSASVLCTFIPTLPDELNINTGDVVRVLAEYDDGWALCMNANNEQGMVPLECLDRSGAVPMPGGGSGQRDPREYKRVSSLTTSSGRSGPTMLAPNRFN